MQKACKQAQIDIKDLPELLGVSASHYRCVLNEKRPFTLKMSKKHLEFFAKQGVWADWWCLVEKSNELPNL